MHNRFQSYIAAACVRPLQKTEAEDAFNLMMDGEVTDAQISGFLVALRMRGETVDEITAAARVMRTKCRPVQAPDHAIDVVGTGGDGKGTLNISTATAIVVAAAGIPVAKHGNRGISSQSGAADLLSQLGVNVMAEPEITEKALRTASIGFMMAPVHHPAMRHVMVARQELGMRTIFNILGPLTNPAGVRRQLTGAYSRDLLRPMAETLGLLGTKRAWLVHGKDGSDEVSICGTTDVVELHHQELTEFTIDPEDAGLTRHDMSEIAGGSPNENLAALERLLDGERFAYRDAVLLNGAASLIVAGGVDSLPLGVERCRDAIDSGRAKSCARQLVQVTTAN